MKHIIAECVLEYKLTYRGERLFGASILDAVIESIKETIKCFIELIKSNQTKDNLNF